MRLTKSVIIVLTLVCFNTVKLLSCVNLHTLFLFNILLAIFCSYVYVVQIQLVNFHQKNKTEFLLWLINLEIILKILSSSDSLNCISRNKVTHIYISNLSISQHQEQSNRKEILTINDIDLSIENKSNTFNHSQKAIMERPQVCYRLNCIPSKLICWSSNSSVRPGTSEFDLIWNRVIADVVS